MPTRSITANERHYGRFNHSHALVLSQAIPKSEDVFRTWPQDSRISAPPTFALRVLRHSGNPRFVGCAYESKKNGRPLAKTTLQSKRERAVWWMRNLWRRDYAWKRVGMKRIR